MDAKEAELSVVIKRKTSEQTKGIDSYVKLLSEFITQDRHVSDDINVNE